MREAGTPPEVDLPDDALQVATAGRPHGVHGEVRLFATSGRPERLRGLTRVWTRRDGADGAVAREVLGMRLHGNAALTRLEGIEDRDDAARLTGSEVWALPGELPGWGEDEFAAADVVGARLFDGDRPVGTIVDLVENAGRSHLDVELEDRRRVFVPTVKDWLVEADLDRGRIVMTLPEGLLD